MKIIQQIANDIHPMITMTTDIPSNYAEKKVPMLDVKVWVEPEAEDDILKIRM